MWRGIFNLAMVCVCTIWMPPLAAPTIQHGKGLISCLGCAQGGVGGAQHGGGGNPANDLVALVNGDRAGAKLPTLRNSKGLGCMALQYISRCSDKSGCATNGTLAPPCRPPETDITEVYAANCGVELPTVDVISGRLLGCLDGDAFYIANATVFRGKEHAQVGAGVDKGFWCLLFSSGSPNSSFLLEDAGRGIAQTHGCFSDPDVLSCTSNSAGQIRPLAAGFFTATLLLLLLFLL